MYRPYAGGYCLGEGARMTAEAIVMNRSAVALAADSAVTIGRADPPGVSKTYEGANKLFELIKGSNIGIMIYSSAEINSTPWETIIKSYRQENPGFTASHVSDYTDHFLRYIAEHEHLLRPQDELLTAKNIAARDIYSHIIEGLYNRPEWELFRSNGTMIQSKMKAALNVIVDEWAAEVDDATEMNFEDSAKIALGADFRGPILDKILRAILSYRIELSGSGSAT